MATIDSKRFTKFRLQLELLASHTSYNSEDFVFKYSYNDVVLPTTNFDVYWSADNTMYVSVGEEYVIFGITDAEDGHSVMAIHKRNLYEADMYEEDYQRRYDGVLDFVFYIIAYRYRRYGKEIVNFYEVCHKL